MDKIQRTIRLSEQDREAIAAIREQYGLTSDSEAIRFALRMALREGKQSRLPHPNKERRSHPHA
jgi:Arc/MetJ-type ribon-helix-helix transcriptional regulator